MDEMELMYQNAKMFYEMQKYETAYNLCEDLIKAGCVKAYTLKALIIGEEDEKGTTKAVIAAIFLGWYPNISIRGEMMPPPPTPSKPERSPASEPIRLSLMYGLLLLYCDSSFFLWKKNMALENTRKAMKSRMITVAGINFETQAPTIAKRKEKMMIGIPALKSSLLFRILLTLAPARLTVL